MTYRPHPVEHDGLVVEDADGNRLIAIPTASVELLEAAYVLQYTRNGITQRFQVGRPGGPLVAVPIQPDTPAAPAQAVRCPECRAVAEEPDSVLGCVWCGTPLPTPR